jgi:hypothetical protein
MKPRSCESFDNGWKLLRSGVFLVRLDNERGTDFSAGTADAFETHEQRKEGIPKREFDHSPLVTALLESGHAWEQTILQDHLAQRVLIAEGDGPLYARRFTWEATVDLLKKAEPGSYVYQPTLHLPRSFYRRFEIEADLLTISDNHPDLLAVSAGDDGARIFRVTDLKRGQTLQLTHRVQVLLYALELDEILRDVVIEDARVDLDLGSVWLGAHREPTTFTLRDFRPHLEKFLRHDLMTILTGKAMKARWHVQHRCEWCEYFHGCCDKPALKPWKRLCPASLSS